MVSNSQSQQSPCPVWRLRCLSSAGKPLGKNERLIRTTCDQTLQPPDDIKHEACCYDALSQMVILGFATDQMMLKKLDFCQRIRHWTWRTMQKHAPAGRQSETLEGSSMLQRPHNCLLQSLLHILQPSNILPAHCRCAAIVALQLHMTSSLVCTGT